MIQVNPKPVRGLRMTAIEVLNSAQPSPSLKWRRRWALRSLPAKNPFRWEFAHSAPQAVARVSKIRFARVNSINIGS